VGGGENTAQGGYGTVQSTLVMMCSDGFITVQRVRVAGNQWRTITYATPLEARRQTLQVSSLGDAKSSLGDAKSSLGDAESSLGDAKSSLGDAESSLGDA
jgi:hypothetical protein